MDAEAEAEVILRIASNIEDVGTGKLPLVAIG